MPLKYNHYIASLLLIGFIAGCAQTKPADERFAFDPPADETVDFRSTTVEQQGDGGPKRVTIEFSLQKRGIADGLIQLDLHIRHLSITAPGITMVETKKGTVIVMPADARVTLTTEDSVAYNSSGKAWEKFYQNQARILPHVKGGSFQVTINDRGEVQLVTGFYNMVDKISRTTGIDRREVTQFLHDYVSDAAIRDLLSQAFFYLPGKKIEKGDSWVKNVTLITKAPVKYSHKITVDEMQHGKVAMSVKSVISARTGDENPPYAEGELTGTIVANPTTGMIGNIETDEQVTTLPANSTITRHRSIIPQRF